MSILKGDTAATKDDPHDHLCKVAQSCTQVQLYLATSIGVMPCATNLYISISRCCSSCPLKQANNPIELLGCVIRVGGLSYLGPMLCMIRQPGVQVVQSLPLVKLIGVADAQGKQNLQTQTK